VQAEAACGFPVQNAIRTALLPRSLWVLPIHHVWVLRAHSYIGLGKAGFLPDGNGGTVMQILCPQ